MTPSTFYSILFYSVSNILCLSKFRNCSNILSRGTFGNDFVTCLPQKRNPNST